MIASIRKSDNLIKGLVNFNGEYTTSLPLIKHILVNYFKHLYICEDRSPSLCSNWDYFTSHTLSHNQVLDLERPISNWEIDMVLKSLSPWKH